MKIAHEEIWQNGYKNKQKLIINPSMKHYLEYTHNPEKLQEFLHLRKATYMLEWLLSKHFTFSLTSDQFLRIKDF